MGSASPSGRGGGIGGYWEGETKIDFRDVFQDKKHVSDSGIRVKLKPVFELVERC